MNPVNTVNATAFILANTRLAPVPAIPEIRLHQSEDAFILWEQTEQELGEPDQQPPFWAFAWPGGLAMARYLLDHPDQVRGRRVLDLGSGSGLTAIAAALAGAASVTASELDPFAIAAIDVNAAANNVRVSTTGNVLGSAPGDTSPGDTSPDSIDLVLAADIWYERQLSARALAFLERARARGASILVADVGRAFLPRQVMRELAAYDVPVVAELENAPVKRAFILTLR